MKKKYFKLTALVLAGMLAINVWSHSVNSKADSTEDASANINTSNESTVPVSAEGTTKNGTSNGEKGVTDVTGGAENPTTESGDEEIAERPIPKEAVKWEKADFDVQVTEVRGFSEEGYKKLKRAEEGFVLTFPDDATSIGLNAFHIDNLKANGVKEGIKGEIVFGKNMWVIGNSAFQGNRKITKITVEDGPGVNGTGDDETKVFLFGTDSFNATNKIVDEKGNARNAYGDYVSTYKEEAPSELKELKLGKRAYHFHRRAFVKTGLREIDFANSQSYLFNGKRNSSEIFEYTFYSSEIESIKAWGDIGRIDTGGFAGSKLKELTIGASIWGLRFHSFRGNKNLTSLKFEPRTGRIQIDATSFTNCNITGVLELPETVGELGGKNFYGNQITKVIWTGKPTHLGYFTFEKNPIESFEGVTMDHWMDYYPYAGIKALKNVKFQPDAKRMINAAFMNDGLRSLEIPETMMVIGSTNGNQDFKKDSDPDATFKGNVGWYPKQGENPSEEEKKVALYRRDTSGKYVTDNLLEDDLTYVVNPVLVEVKLVNQLGETIDKELTLNGNIVRKKGTEDAKLENIQIEGKENWMNFKLGDSYTFAAPELEGLELREVDGKKIEGSVPSEITVEISTENGTKEEKYDDSYKVGYMKKVITLTYFDKNAKKDPVIPSPVIPDPVIPDPVIPDPVIPDSVIPNPVIPDPVIPDPVIPDPVVPAPTPIVPNLPTPPVEVAEAETVSEVVPEIPEVNPEEILSVEEAEIPESPAAILPTDEEAENLDILGDEIPQGKTEIKKDKEKKGKAKKAVSKNALAKTGGLQNIFFYALSGLMVLLAAFGFIEVFRKRKERD